MTSAASPTGNAAYDALAEQARALRESRDRPTRPLIRVDLTTSSVAAGRSGLGMRRTSVPVT